MITDTPFSQMNQAMHCLIDKKSAKGKDNIQFYERSARMSRRYVCILFKDDNKGYI